MPSFRRHRNTCAGPGYSVRSIGCEKGRVLPGKAWHHYAADRFFAPLRMTAFRRFVILSEAKDLYETKKGDLRFKTSP